MKIFNNICFVCFTTVLLLSCSIKNRIEKYYTSNKNEIDTIVLYSNVVKNKYKIINVIRIRHKVDLQSYEIEIEISRPYKNMTLYINETTYHPVLENPCDSCSTIEKDELNRIKTDNNLLLILKCYSQIKCKGIQVDSNGVFISTGKTTYNPTSLELEEGIYISSNKFIPPRAKKLIEKNVFISEDVIP